MAIEETLDRLATNIALLTGAVATLSESVNGKYAGKPIYSGEGAPSSPPAPDSAQTPPATPAPAKRGRGRPAADDPKPAQTPAPAPTVASEPDPFEDPAGSVPQAPVATLDDVRTAMKTLAAAINQDQALAVLKAAGGVSNLTELQRTPEKYGAVVAAAKKATAEKADETAEADPFETPPPAQNTAAPAAAEEKAPSKEDVKAALVKAQKRTGVDIVQAVVMKHGGKAPGEGGKIGPSLTALPVSAYAAVIKEVGELPTTKT
jgi:hypothetical protein